MTNRTSRGAQRRALRASARPAARYVPSLGKPNRHSPFHDEETALLKARRDYRAAIKQAGELAMKTAAAVNADRRAARIAAAVANITPHECFAINAAERAERKAAELKRFAELMALKVPPQRAVA